MVSARKHLSGREFEQLLEAVRGRRNEVRDRCLILLMFRHELRVSEACGLVLEQVDVESRVLDVARIKGGLSTIHPLRGDEIRAIMAWLIEWAAWKRMARSWGGRSSSVSSASSCNAQPSTWPCANMERRPAFPLPSIPTRCAMPAVLLSPTRVRTPA